VDILRAAIDISRVRYFRGKKEEKKRESMSGAVMDGFEGFESGDGLGPRDLTCPQIKRSRATYMQFPGKLLVFKPCYKTDSSTVTDDEWPPACRVMPPARGNRN